jgi:hypothetical protein
MSDDALLLFQHWERVVEEVLKRTGDFPKKARFTFSGRIDNLALDIIEAIVEARYSRKRRRERLHEVNLKLTRLRVLLRISHQQRYLSHAAYEQLSRLINEAGRMVGGWVKVSGDVPEAQAL